MVAERISGQFSMMDAWHGIRHLGGRAYAIIEMSERRCRGMLPCRLEPHRRSNLRDDPLVQQGDASVLRSLIQSSPARSEAWQLAAGPLPTGPGPQAKQGGSGGCD